MKGYTVRITSAGRMHKAHVYLDGKHRFASRSRPAVSQARAEAEAFILAQQRTGDGRNLAASSMDYVLEVRVDQASGAYYVEIYERLTARLLHRTANRDSESLAQAEGEEWITSQIRRAVGLEATQEI